MAIETPYWPDLEEPGTSRNWGWNHAVVMTLNKCINAINEIEERIGKLNDRWNSEMDIVQTDISEQAERIAALEKLMPTPLRENSGHWECSECEKDWTWYYCGYDKKCTYECYLAHGGCGAKAVRWVEQQEQEETCEKCGLPLQEVKDYKGYVVCPRCIGRPIEQQESDPSDLARSFLRSGNQYWKWYNEHKTRHAVVWLRNDETGEVAVYTRAEYGDALINFVENIDYENDREQQELKPWWCDHCGKPIPANDIRANENGTLSHLSNDCEHEIGYRSRPIEDELRKEIERLKTLHCPARIETLAKCNEVWQKINAEKQELRKENERLQAANESWNERYQALCKRLDDTEMTELLLQIGKLKAELHGAKEVNEQLRKEIKKYRGIAKAQLEITQSWRDEAKQYKADRAAVKEENTTLQKRIDAAIDLCDTALSRGFKYPATAREMRIALTDSEDKAK